MYIAALDIGGTKTIAAVLDEKGVLIYAPYAGWEQVPVAEFLDDRKHGCGRSGGRRLPADPRRIRVCGGTGAPEGGI